MFVHSLLVATQQLLSLYIARLYSHVSLADAFDDDVCNDYPLTDPCLRPTSMIPVTAAVVDDVPSVHEQFLTCLSHICRSTDGCSLQSFRWDLTHCFLCLHSHQTNCPCLLPVLALVPCPRPSRCCCCTKRHITRQPDPCPARLVARLCLH